MIYVYDYSTEFSLWRLKNKKMIGKNLPFYMKQHLYRLFECFCYPYVFLLCVSIVTDAF